MFLIYKLSFFKKGDTIQGVALFKGGHYFRKYGKNLDNIEKHFTVKNSSLENKLQGDYHLMQFFPTQDNKIINFCLSLLKKTLYTYLHTKYK